MSTTRQSTRAGYRFILRRDVDRFPDFLATKGMTGTVKEVLDDGVIIAAIDQHIAGAEEWDNELHWMEGEAVFLADTAPLGE